MEQRIGLKIGILAFMMFILTFSIWLIHLILVSPFTDYWIAIPFILCVFLALIILSMILHRIIREHRKSALIDHWYKQSGLSAVIIGLMICFAIPGGFIFPSVVQVGDAIIAILGFLSGILLIISGIITNHEIRERTEKIDLEK